MSLEELINVARGHSPADLLLANAKIVNTLTGEIEDGNVTVYQGKIAGIGNYHLANMVIDLEGKYLAPGLIDGHVHVESSLLHPTEYAKAVVPRGISGIITDLHEIANVTGVRGIRYMMESVRKLPLNFYYMAPSCVPATDLETSGARLGTKALRAALKWKHVIGLGEVMNFPGVLNQDPDVMNKIKFFKDKPIDGHAPGLSGNELNAYLAAGIASDHESTTFEEGLEKLRRGMYLMIREGSSEKNLDALLPLVTDKTYKRCLFVVDDRTCTDLFTEGDLDAVVRKAISKGLDPIRAIQLATINAAEYFGLRGIGAISPGYIANIAVFPNLSDFRPEKVFYNGKLVADRGETLFSASILEDEEMTHTVNIKPFNIEQLRISASTETYPVIEIVPDQIITKKIVEPVKIKDNCVAADTDRDILKLVVMERHKATGNTGLGLVHGFGLKKGALGSSIAHDSHNIIVAGTNDRDIFITIKEIERLQGGLVAVADGKILGSLPLPIAGLLSNEPLEAVVQMLKNLIEIASNLGSRLSHPFATLSFLALPVIPELRLTDLGLVDVSAFKLIDSG